MSRRAEQQAGEHDRRRGSLPAAVTRVALAFVLVGLLAACGIGRGDSAGDDSNVAVQIDPEEPGVGPAHLTITIDDDDGEPLAGADVKVEGNMNHAGMVPVFREAEEVADGAYVVDDFEFTMPGDWFILITGTTSDGEAFNYRVDVEGVLNVRSSPSGTSQPMKMEHPTATESDD